MKPSEYLLWDELEDPPSTQQFPMSIQCIPHPNVYYRDGRSLCLPELEKRLTSESKKLL